MAGVYFLGPDSDCLCARIGDFLTIVNEKSKVCQMQNFFFWNHFFRRQYVAVDVPLPFPHNLKDHPSSCVFLCEFAASWYTELFVK